MIRPLSFAFSIHPKDGENFNASIIAVAMADSGYSSA
jgi:hypothetical protein